MSKISTAYDAITSKLATLYSSKTQIPNPYSISDNVDRFLVNGYGLKVNPQSNVQLEFNTIVSDYDMSAVFTRELLILDCDVTARHTTIKQLLEDAQSFKGEFGNYQVLSLPDYIDHITLTGTTSIQEFLVGKNNFLSIEATMLVRITENI